MAGEDDILQRVVVKAEDQASAVFNQIGQGAERIRGGATVRSA
jgi:hypothetical protein